MSSDSLGTDKPVRSMDGMVRRQTPLAPKMPARREPTFRFPAMPAKKVLYGGIGLTVLAGVLIGGVLLFTRGDNSLPTSITKQAGFPLYYPSATPLGYTYQRGSAKISGDVVDYRLKNGDSVVTISEQAVPANPPTLSRLLGFTSLSTEAGIAAVGTTNTKQPLVVIISNTTLITITGQSGMPSDVVSKLAQAMSSLPQS